MTPAKWPGGASTCENIALSFNPVRDSGAAVALAAGNLGRERFQAMHPEPAKLIEPGVDLSQRTGLDRVDAACAIDAHAGEAGIAQNLEMLRDRRLGDAELALDDG